MAESYAQVARGAINVESRLSQTSSRAVSENWSGLGATAFLDAVSELPAMATKAFDSFSEARQALLTYSSDLSLLQQRAETAHELAHSALAEISAAVDARSDALYRYGRQADIDELNRLERWIGERAVADQFSGRIQAAEAELDAQQREAERIRQSHGDAVEAALASVQRAREVGIRNAIRFSAFGISPFGEHLTLRDFGESFNEAWDSVKPAVLVVGILALAVASGGTAIPVLGTTVTVAGAASGTVGGLAAADTAIRGARKYNTDDSGVEETWFELAVDGTLSVLSLGSALAVRSANNTYAVTHLRQVNATQRASEQHLSAMKRIAAGARPSFGAHPNLPADLLRQSQNNRLKAQILSREIPKMRNALHNREQFESAVEVVDLLWGARQNLPKLNTVPGSLRVVEAPIILHGGRIPLRVQP